MPHRPKKEGGTFVIGKIVDTDGKVIGKGFCLIFRAPGSYTGEHTVEIYGHGGAVVLRKILRRAREQLTGLEDEGIALAVEHLRDALESLGQVTGRFYHNELLDDK